MDKNRVFHVISNTHWDREWRYTFQKNRQMLVAMIDRLLEILAAQPEYRAFHLDSQTIVLNDYLEIRPQKREILRDYITSGRILAGPWYILPDEFQVGGENLVRNLLKGHRIAAEFGHVMKVGYSPFSWGQISQLPQIYTGFDIDVVMFYRGVNSLDSEKAEFIWSGADGTEVLASRFSTMPRYNFYFYIYRPVVLNEQIPDVEYKWTKGGAPFHFADSDLAGEDYSLLRPLNEYHESNLIPAIDAIIGKQVKDFTTKHIFWAEGHDSSGPSATTVRIIKEANEYLENDQVIHSTLEEYAAGLKSAVDRKKLALVTGERRSSQYDSRSGNMYGYTTSARMDLKILNFNCEKWLQFYAEPFHHIAGILGMDTRDQYLEQAWDLLLQNSAHDSIGGCSLDEIHDDMICRYKQSQEISRGLLSSACRYLCASINLADASEKDIHLVALNPNTFSRDEIVEAFIDIPEELDKGSLQVSDMHGTITDVQIVDQKPVEPVLEQMTDRPMHLRMNRYHCFISLNALNPMGIRTYKVIPVEKQSIKEEIIGRRAGNSFVLENKFLRVRIAANGTLDILAKSNNSEFAGLAYFADEGEAGYAWTHEAVDPVYTTLDARPDFEIIHNGPLMCRCRVRHQLLLPANLEERRAGKKDTPISILLDVSLTRHGHRIGLDVQVDNRAEDHRLRMMFPLNLGAKYSYGEGQFDVVARSTHRPDTKNWIEQPMYDYPMHQFVDIGTEERGAALLTGGLKEYEVLDDKNQTLAITLLRAFRYIIQPSSVQDYTHKKGSQCPGKHRFKTAFLVHCGDWQQGQVYTEALNFHNQVRIMQIGNTKGEIEPDTSFLAIDPRDLIFSSLKSSEDGQGYVLRLYNPTTNDMQGKISFLWPVCSAWKVSLEEMKESELHITDKRHIPIHVNAKKIYTIKIIFENEGTSS